MNVRPEGWAHSTNQRSLPGPIEESRVKGIGTLNSYLSRIPPANQPASTLEPRSIKAASKLKVMSLKDAYLRA